MIYGWATYSRLQTDSGVFYPIWCEVLGNLMCGLTVSGIIIYAIYAAIDVYRNKKVGSFFDSYPFFILVKKSNDLKI